MKDENKKNVLWHRYKGNVQVFSITTDEENNEIERRYQEDPECIRKRKEYEEKIKKYILENHKELKKILG